MTFRFPFPHFPLSLHSVHCIATNSDLMYKYSSPALLKGTQLWPNISLPFCVRFRATAALSLSCSSLFAFPHHARSSDPIPSIATRHSRPRTHAFRSLVISSPSRLDRCPVTHACGSGNNKPRTPLLIYSRARSPFGNVAWVLFSPCASLNSRADFPSAFHHL